MSKEEAKAIEWECERCGHDEPEEVSGAWRCPKCGWQAPGCTCYEVTGGHQPGCMFNQFRRKLEDTVLLGLAKGKLVSADTLGAWCPLGCAEPLLCRRPGAVAASQAFGIGEKEARSFIRGFECAPDDSDGAYYNLGKLYRKRFP